MFKKQYDTAVLLFFSYFPGAATLIAKPGKEKSRKHYPKFIVFSEQVPLPLVTLQENMYPLVRFLLLLLSALCVPKSLFPSVESSRLCSHQCNCYEHAELVDCRGRGFEHVPRGVPHGTWLLELGGNYLSQIGTHAFTGLWSLRVLVLTNSQILEIQPQVGTIKDSYWVLINSKRW